MTKSAFIAFTIFVFSLFMGAGVALGQTVTPTSSPTPTTSITPTVSPTPRLTVTPTPTTQVPQGAPVTGFGGY